MKFVSEKVNNINEVISLDLRAREFSQSIVADFTECEKKGHN